MKKTTYLQAALLFLLQVNISWSQTTLLNETFLTQPSFDTFTTVSVAGSQNWYYNSSYGAVCSGFFNGQSNENEDWLISPALNLAQSDNVQLTFDHTRGSAAVMNAGVTQGWYKAFATANYTGNPATTQWIELTGLNQNITNAWQFISSGTLIIPEAAKSENTRIAFRYISSSEQSATWEIKNVKVTAQSDVVNPDSNYTLSVTNWNTEWLGCSQFGPNNESQQLANVASAMLEIDSDIYCLQEISNTDNFPTMQSLVTQMGADLWGGVLVPAITDDCEQRQALIYKKARVQFISATELSSGAPAQGNSYYHNWTSGRYPALYNVNIFVGDISIPISIINIHAKAEDGNPASYTRRLGGSEGLKGILDGDAYNTKNLILTGDFNDYLIGTTSEACQCSDSPFRNFVEDTDSYIGITQDVIDLDTSFGTHPIIENTIISNELEPYYVANSAAQEIDFTQNINNYFYSTSDHLPVTALFDFTTMSRIDFNLAKDKLSIYPNPVLTVLHITGGFTDKDEVSVFDITGRKMMIDISDNSSINISSLPIGIYILKVGSQSTKFIKE